MSESTVSKIVHGKNYTPADASLSLRDCDPSRAAAIVREMLDMPQWQGRAESRLALLIAANAIERGRHLTVEERNANLKRFMMEEGE